LCVAGIKHKGKNELGARCFPSSISFFFLNSFSASGSPSKLLTNAYLHACFFFYHREWLSTRFLTALTTPPCPATAAAACVPISAPTGSSLLRERLLLLLLREDRDRATPQPDQQQQTAAATAAREEASQRCPC
jgi:hypothetical protein